MKFTFYRALGRESSYFGIAESYISWFLACAVVSMAPSLLVGRLIAPLVGYVCYGGLFLGSYLGVIYIQSRLSVRDLRRLISGRRHPSRILCRPLRLDAYLSRWSPSVQSHR